jgi:hypothetical protein
VAGELEKSLKTAPCEAVLRVLGKGSDKAKAQLFVGAQILGGMTYNNEKSGLTPLVLSQNSEPESEESKERRNAGISGSAITRTSLQRGAQLLDEQLKFLNELNEASLAIAETMSPPGHSIGPAQPIIMNGLKAGASAPYSAGVLPAVLIANFAFRALFKQKKN